MIYLAHPLLDRRRYDRRYGPLVRPDGPAARAAGQEVSLLPATVLLVCPDLKGLTSLAGALSGHFPVLAARSGQEAVRLASLDSSCRLAYCDLGDNTRATLDLAARLAMVRPGLAIIALVRPPCPESIRSAVADGLLHGVGLLPMSQQAFRAKTRAVIASDAPPGQERQTGRILTRDEIDFLLGRPTPARTTPRQTAP